MTKVPNSLKFWFIFHFILDVLIAVPLLFLPNLFLGLFGFSGGELTARLVGAALIAIGVNSYLMHDKSIDIYRSMLNLKILWSGAAILGILLTILNGASNLVWIFLVIFAVFNAVWVYYRFNLPL